jgi:hypothetical protein
MTKNYRKNETPTYKTDDEHDLRDQNLTVGEPGRLVFRIVVVLLIHARSMIGRANECKQWPGPMRFLIAFPLLAGHTSGPGFKGSGNMWLPIVAAVGMILPGGLFLYWLFHDYSSLSAALSDRFALAFVADVFGSTFLLAYLFAHKPLGPVKWQWFLVLSLLGTLWFAIPLYFWLNWRCTPKPRPTFIAWWRTV